MNHLEIEYKTLLTKNEYQQLLPLFADVKPIILIHLTFQFEMQKWHFGFVLLKIVLS